MSIHFNTTLSRFFAGWLVAIAAFAALLFWAHSSFDAKRPDMTAAPAAAAKAEPVTLSPSAETSVPAFDADAATHLATAFPMQGVHQINDASPAVSFFPPDSSLTVQVIERDSLPRPLTDGVTVRYRLKDAYAGGRNKDAATGDLDTDASSHSFTSDGIAVTPYAFRQAGAVPAPPRCRGGGSGRQWRAFGGHDRRAAGFG